MSKQPPDSLGQRVTSFLPAEFGSSAISSHVLSLQTLRGGGEACLFMVPEQPALSFMFSCFPSKTLTCQGWSPLTAHYRPGAWLKHCILAMGDVSDILIQELVAAPDFHRLIRSVQAISADQHLGTASDDDCSDVSEHGPTPQVVLMTARTLYEHCQQMTCTSSDTTLAMKGLSDQEATLLQVHKYDLSFSAQSTASGHFLGCDSLCVAGVSWQLGAHSFRLCFPQPGPSQLLSMSQYQQRR